MKAAAGGTSGCFASSKQVCCGAAPLTHKDIQEFEQTLPHVDFIQVRFALVSFISAHYFTK